VDTAVAPTTVAPPAPQPEAVFEINSTDPVLSGRALVEARLRARHPEATAAMVRRSVEAAIGFYRFARVRVYLPILIERRASSSLQESMGLHLPAGP
jgi:hypothetical protein